MKKFICNECHTTFTENPDPKFGDCPICTFASEIREMTAEEKSAEAKHEQLELQI